MAAKKFAPASSTVKPEPATQAEVVAPAVAVAPDISPIDDISPIEDVVGISPVVETLTTAMAVIPQKLADVVTDFKNAKTEGTTNMDKTMKSAEELMSFGQGNVEAILKSSQIWAAGVQDLGKHFAATAQAQMDETMATVKALSGVKSLKEAMDMQSVLAKTAVEKLMAESGKLTDASMKLAEQAMAPISARMTLAAEKFTKAA